MTYHLPPVMALAFSVMTQIEIYWRLLGGIATPTATGVPVQTQAKLRQGMPGVLVGDPRARKSAQIYQYRR
jgi:hypothetical protein